MKITKCIIVCTVPYSKSWLQVTAAMGAVSLYGMRGDVIPALGLSWANLVTTRLMMTRTPSYCPATHENMQSGNRGSNTIEADRGSTSRKMLATEYNVRLLEVVFCPWLGRESCAFIVCEEGIRGVDLEEIYKSASIISKG